MTKRIETIEDLAKIAGAELGRKQGKSKIEAAVEDATKPKKPSKPKRSTPSKPGKKPTKPKRPKKSDEFYNALETGTITLYPYAVIDLEEARNRPTEINNYTRSLKVKDLPNLIEEETLRAATLIRSYESGLARGDNCIGYVLASLSVERDVKRMQAYLDETNAKEKLDG